MLAKRAGIAVRIKFSILRILSAGLFLGPVVSDHAEAYPYAFCGLQWATAQAEASVKPYWSYARLRSGFQATGTLISGTAFLTLAVAEEAFFSTGRS